LWVIYVAYCLNLSAHGCKEIGGALAKIFTKLNQVYALEYLSHSLRAYTLDDLPVYSRIQKMHVYLLCKL